MEDIIKSIDTLSSKYHKEIFLFLKSNKVQYSKNQNGVFINMSLLSDDIIDELKILVNKYKEHTLSQTDINTKNNCIIDVITNGVNSSTNYNTVNDKVSATDEILISFNHKDVAYLEKDKQKINKKNVHLKFNTAIKKYNKYSSNDYKKFEFTLHHSLDFENYII